MASGIYAITNKVNGKRYIGSAVHLKRRWLTHQWHMRDGAHPNSHLQNAYNKYGKENFEFSVLMICAKDMLVFYEQRCIEAFDAVKRGYNVRVIADSNLGVVHSAETRARRASISRDMWKREGHRERVVASAKKAWTPELREAKSKSSRAMWLDEEYRGGLLTKKSVWANDPAWRAKVGAGTRASLDSPEMRLRWSETAKKNNARPDVKALVAASSKKRWQDPNYRERISAARRAMWANPEIRAKIKAARDAACNTVEYRESQRRKAKEHWDRRRQVQQK